MFDNDLDEYHTVLSEDCTRLQADILKLAGMLKLKVDPTKVFKGADRKDRNAYSLLTERSEYELILASLKSEQKIIKAERKIKQKARSDQVEGKLKAAKKTNAVLEECETLKGNNRKKKKVEAQSKTFRLIRKLVSDPRKYLLDSRHPILKKIARLIH